jgi:hypothetical protein
LSKDSKTAGILSWLILSALGLLLLLAPWVVSQQTLLSLSDRCKVKHFAQEPCLVCGMTRSWIALAQGRWAEAFSIHRGGPMWFGLLAANELAAAGFVVYRWRQSRIRCAGTREMENGRAQP